MNAVEHIWPRAIIARVLAILGTYHSQFVLEYRDTEWSEYFAIRDKESDITYRLEVDHGMWYIRELVPDTDMESIGHGNEAVRKIENWLNGGEVPR